MVDQMTSLIACVRIIYLSQTNLALDIYRPSKYVFRTSSVHMLLLYLFGKERALGNPQTIVKTGYDSFNDLAKIETSLQLQRIINVW